MLIAETIGKNERVVTHSADIIGKNEGVEMSSARTQEGVGTYSAV